jgi:hypothetical protein
MTTVRTQGNIFCFVTRICTCGTVTRCPNSRQRTACASMILPQIVQLHGAQTFLRNSYAIREPEVSLPCSQELVTGTYPVPKESISSLPTYFFMILLTISSFFIEVFRLSLSFFTYQKVVYIYSSILCLVYLLPGIPPSFCDR